MGERHIAIHPAAPPKPAWGAACNGCGLCCLAEPCPIGRLISLRRRGACRALVWEDGPHGNGQYRCGVLAGRRDRLPRWLRPLGGWLQRRAGRWIAAGAGCDCDMELAD